MCLTRFVWHFRVAVATRNQVQSGPTLFDNEVGAGPTLTANGPTLSENKNSRCAHS